MARFFIDRPIFAWVIAIIVMLTGVLSIARLPISRYPTIAPPSVTVSAFYPGASAQTVEDSVTQIVEQSMKGLDGLLYMSSTSESSGAVAVTLTFANGVDPDIAQVQVQNKLQGAIPLLPQTVQQQGISVTKANPSFLLVVGFVSEDGRMARIDIDDYVASHLVEPLSRVKGVGGVTQFGAPYAMRIWLDPEKLHGYKLSPGDIVEALRGQNAQVGVGQLGDAPSVPGQQLNATITAQGRLETPEQFGNIIVRSNPGGSTLRLGDVARVELGSSNYGFITRYNGKPASGVAVNLATNANALEAAQGVEKMVRELEPSFPPGMKAVIPFDTTPFVRASIIEVLKTLLEAVALVFLVMYLFLQNFRATLIPTIAVPVVLLGTFGILAALGQSINMLTMFAMVLAIGLLVDDAIVVVENVERLMRDEHLSPLLATRKSMDQITGALIGIALVLAVVFIPMAFLGGAAGVIYRQFSITIVAAMALSVVVAIILTPALCATMLKPHDVEAHEERGGFFGWFNRGFERASGGYRRAVGGMMRRGIRFMLLYAVLAAVMVYLFLRLPTTFLPNEDQGFLMAVVQAPVGATQERTLKSIYPLENHFLEAEKGTVESLFTVQGFSFAGSGQNTGIAFIKLRDWEERKGKDQSVEAIAGRAMGALMQIKDAMVFAFPPPPIFELGTSSGFDFFLKDLRGQGHDALTAARNQFLGLAAQSKLLQNVRPNGQEDTPELRVDVDIAKAGSLDLSIDEINETLSLAWGGRYVDDFIDRGRVKRVIMQADAPFRMVPGDFERWYVRNRQDQMVPFSAFGTSHWRSSSPRLERYNGAAAMQIVGEAKPGISSGDAMAEVEKLVAQLPPGFGIEFTGQSYQERASGAQTPLLYTLSIIVVFLCLAALYESWSIPTSVLLVVPLGVLGAVLATMLRGLQRDIYFQVAMLATVGLSSKNAILIVEFAKKHVEEGLGLIEATLHAVRDRLRPILMTSLAFGLGVLPLALASGAGSGAQRAIGTGVLGGMMAGTFLGIFFVPVFFVVVASIFRRRPRAERKSLEETVPGVTP